MRKTKRHAYHHIDLMDSKITEKKNVQKVELSVSLSWLSESGKYTCTFSCQGKRFPYKAVVLIYKCKYEIVFISFFRFGMVCVATRLYQ